MSEVSEDKKKRAPTRYWVEKNGSLYARLQYKDETGKRREKYRVIADKRKARTAVDKMRQELETHGSDTLQADKVTFKQLAEKYKKAKVFPAIIVDGVKVGGLKSFKPVETYVKIALEYFGEKHVRSIKSSDIEKFKQLRLKTEVQREVKVKIPYTDENGKIKHNIKKQLQKTPRKVSAVNRELATLRAMLSFAEEEGWILKNPFPANAITISGEKERERILSHAEEKLLLAECKDNRAHLKGVLICALDTAMRPDEIFKLSWNDIDFDLSSIRIRAENSKMEKTRYVWMSSRLKLELGKLWNASPKDLEGSVFGIKSVKTAFRNACSKAGIEGFRLRDARHTATTRMILAGYSHAEVMKVTGHNQMKTFLRYLNITPETVSEKTSRMDIYLNEKGKIINEVKT